VRRFCLHLASHAKRPETTVYDLSSKVLKSINHSINGNTLSMQTKAKNDP